MIDISNVPIDELLPHEAPMVLLDRGVSYDESTLVAEVDVREDSLFCGDNGIPGWVGVEYMAQAVAAHAGYQGRQEGKEPEIGYLLGTRSYQCAVPVFPIGETLTIRVESLYTEMGLGAFACRIEMGETVAEATINVYQPEDGQGTGIDTGRIPQ